MYVDRTAERRKERESHFAGRYEPAARGRAECCYCGDLRGRGRDHVPPLAAAQSFRKDFPFWTYPACAACNCALRDLPLTCLMERARELVEILGSRIEKTWEATGDVERVQSIQDHAERVFDRWIGGAVSDLCRCPACYGPGGKGLTLRFHGYRRASFGNDEPMFDDGGRP